MKTVSTRSYQERKTMPPFQPWRCSSIFLRNVGIPPADPHGVNIPEGHHQRFLQLQLSFRTTRDFVPIAPLYPQAAVGSYYQTMFLPYQLLEFRFCNIHSIAFVTEHWDKLLFKTDFIPEHSKTLIHRLLYFFLKNGPVRFWWNWAKIQQKILILSEHSGECFFRNKFYLIKNYYLILFIGAEGPQNVPSPFASLSIREQCASDILINLPQPNYIEQGCLTCGVTNFLAIQIK